MAECEPCPAGKYQNLAESSAVMAQCQGHSNCSRKETVSSLFFTIFTKSFIYLNLVSYLF